MRKSVIIFCTVLLMGASAVFSQNTPKTLLWRISGNGLQKPSYLFGTMHVYDPRLFNLGDSVLNGIKTSDGFANELDFNQITPIIMELVKKEINDATVKQMMSENAYKKYGTALSKKFGKPAEQITTSDILKEKNKWIDESFKGEKMQTFLDAYLADLAYRQGKWMGGVEDLADQSGILAVDESDIRQIAIGSDAKGASELDRMTDIYLHSDLDGIQSVFNEMDSNVRDMMLIKRNKKMAFRMDSLAHIRTMFFAVGAAHLPGSEGLIQLLRTRGFTVSPVFSTKRIDPKDYVVPEINKPWVEVNDPDGRYTVMMPGTPGDLKVYGIMSMEMYFNIFNGTYYLASSIPIPMGKSGVDSVSKAMVDQLFGKSAKYVETNIEINRVQGKSYLQQDKKGYKKLNIFNQGNIIYYVVGFASSNNKASILDLDKFFNSYQIKELSETSENNSIDFTDSVDFFSAVLPTIPKPFDNIPNSGDTRNTGTKARMLIASDPVTGNYYFLAVNRCTVGYTYPNDSITLGTAKTNMKQKMTDITRDTMYFSNGMGFAELEGAMQNGSMRAKIRLWLRGNRYYLMLVMPGPGEGNKSAEKVLKSFHLSPVPAAHWRTESPADHFFTTVAPAKIAINQFWNDDSTKSGTQYLSFDSNYVHSYVLRADTLEKYFWRENDSVFWNYQKNRFLDKSDTLLSEKKYLKDSIFQYEFSFRHKHAVNVTRLKMWIRGDILYRLTTTQEPATINSENTTQFFDQLRFNNRAPTTHAFDVKTALLLTDLSASDSTTREQAKDALFNAPFSTADIPSLQKALIKEYPLDTGSYISVNQKIANRLLEFGDSAQAVFARSQFPVITSTDANNALLFLISAYHTKSNYDSLIKLLMSYTPTHSLSYRVTSKMTDSLLLTARLFPAILPLIQNQKLASDILDIASTLQDSNLIATNMLRPWQSIIVQYAETRYRDTKKDTLNYTREDYAVIDILKHFKSDSSNAMLKKWLNVKGNSYHKQDIVSALLENNQTIPAQVLTELAADRSTRLQLYKNLKKNKKLALFPAKYLTQSYFAASLAEESAYEILEDDFEIKLIREKVMKWKGQMKRFFFYDVYEENDNAHWLIVAGPFDINKSIVSLSEAKSDMYSDEQYDAPEFDKQAKELMEMMEKK